MNKTKDEPFMLQDKLRIVPHKEKGSMILTIAGEGSATETSTLDNSCLTNLLCTSNANLSKPRSFSNNLRTPSKVKVLH